MSIEKSSLEDKNLSLEIEIEQLRKDLAKAQNDLTTARNEGVDEKVDIVYKILHLKDLDYSIEFIYETLKKDPPPLDVILPE